MNKNYFFIKKIKQTIFYAYKKTFLKELFKLLIPYKIDYILI